MSLRGKRGYETLRKRIYRAKRLRESDPAKFYMRRHKHKLARRRPRMVGYQPITMADIVAMTPTMDDLCGAPV